MDQELHIFLGKMLAAMRHVVGSMPNPSNQVWHTLAGLEREHAALVPPPLSYQVNPDSGAGAIIETPPAPQPDHSASE
jgi:hypothetical protein